MVVKFSEVFLLNKEVSKLFIGTKLKKNILVLLNINELEINKNLRIALYQLVILMF